MKNLFIVFLIVLVGCGESEEEIKRKELRAEFNSYVDSCKRYAKLCADQVDRAWKSYNVDRSEKNFKLHKDSAIHSYEMQQRYYDSTLITYEKIYGKKYPG